MEVSLCGNLRSTQPPFSRQIPRPARWRTNLALVSAGPRAAATARLPGLAAECVSSGPVSGEEEEEWIRAARLDDKCGGADVAGLAELLECLEREAIMGEDHGRDPNDYNRRAQIFDKSSRVFQALKERSSSNTTTCTESS